MAVDGNMFLPLLQNFKTDSDNGTDLTLYSANSDITYRSNTNNSLCQFFKCDGKLKT